MVSSGIEQILNSCLSFFSILYDAGTRFFVWASTPLAPTGDASVDLLLESFFGYTPFEAFFGVAFITIIFFWIIKAFVPV